MNPTFYHALYCSPWNLDGLYWHSMHQAAQAPGNLTLADFFVARPKMEIDQNGIAHIHVVGVLGDLAPIDEMFGDSDYGSIASELDTAKAEASGIMLHVDSPGGQATGNVELAAKVGKVSIPTAAHVSGLGCSAAYAILCGADRVTAGPSSMVGSIGTILPLLDVSGLWESMGIRPDYVTSGDLKAAGYPPAQTPEERESLQQIVDDLFAMFKGHVTRYRDVPDEAMRGQAFVGTRAKSVRLIDAVSDYDSAYRDLVKRV